LLLLFTNKTIGISIASMLDEFNDIG